MNMGIVACSYVSSYPFDMFVRSNVSADLYARRLSRPLLGPFDEVVHMFARIMSAAAPIGVAGVYVQDVLVAMIPVHPKTYWRASINKITVG